MHNRTLSGCLILLLATAAFAQDEVDILSRTPFTPGARAAGMAGAFSALADDYTALYYNPAGLAGMKRMELSASGYIGFAGNEADIGPGSAMTTDDSFAGLSHLGLVLPLPVYRGGISFALGYHRLVDFHQPYGVYGGANSETRVEEEGGVSAWAFGFGFQMSRRFWGGLTLELLTGEEKYLFTNETSQWDEREFSHLALTGTRLTLGGLFHLTDQFRAAMQVRTPVKYNLTWEEYHYALDYTDPTRTDESESAPGYEYKIKIPFELTTGVAWKGRWLSLDADFIFTDWSQAQYDDYFEDTFFEANQSIGRDYKPRLGMRLGAEYNIPTTDLMLRAGVARYPLAGPAEELTPRVLVTGGIGYLIDQVIDLNLAIGYQRSEFEYGIGDGVTLHEDRSSMLIRCGFYYRFQP
jgi:long-chain fatty acid transport protein